jgi:post-segregation antitoxin (ccd killing protein)
LESTTISAKISSKLREKLRKYDVDVSATVRKALAEELSRREADELKMSLERVHASLSHKITAKDVVDAVRRSRDER